MPMTNNPLLDTCRAAPVVTTTYGGGRRGLKRKEEYLGKDCGEIDEPHFLI